MKAALAAVVDGIGFTWRLGGACVHVAIAGLVVGLNRSAGGEAVEGVGLDL